MQQARHGPDVASLLISVLGRHQVGDGRSLRSIRLSGPERLLARVMTSFSGRSKTALGVICLCAAGTGVVWSAACGSSTASTPSGLAAVVPTTASGPVHISFVSAMPPPGSTISGCGPNPKGCQGRLSMTFLLQSNASGTSVVSTAQIDIANQFCLLPLVVDRMTFTIYGEDTLRSAQAFQVRYTFLP
jgi:hypothetical protein